MLRGFDTAHPSAAAAAQTVYALWRSRDVTSLKITPEIWAQVERFTKSAAKRARSIGEFVERLKPRLGCATLIASRTDDGEGNLFLTTLINECDTDDVLRTLHKETAYIVLLVRDRLAREKAEREAAETAAKAGKAEKKAAKQIAKAA